MRCASGSWSRATLTLGVGCHLGLPLAVLAFSVGAYRDMMRRLMPLPLPGVFRRLPLYQGQSPLLVTWNLASLA